MNRSDIARRKVGTVSAALMAKRRFMSASSASSVSAAVTVFGSRAMPQRGQLPGPFWTTSGCIGQV